MDANTLTRYLAGSYCCFFLAIITTVLRLYARLRVLRQVGIDDALIGVAVVFGAVILAMEHCMTISFRAFMKGNGPSQTMSPTNPAAGQLTQGLKYQYVGANIYPAEVMFIKLSLLAFYHRFLPPKPYHWILYVVGVVTILFVTVITLAGIFACRPIAGAWDPTIPGINCPIEVFDTHFSNAIFNVITDIIILVLPIPMVIHLRTDMKKKIALMALFSFGLLGTAITILRVVIMIQIRRVPPALVTVWVSKMMNNIMWSEIEISILIICANIPGIYAIVKRPSASSTTGKRSPYYYNNTGYTKTGDSSQQQRRGASISVGGVGARSIVGDDYDLRLDKPQPSTSASAFGRTSNTSLSSSEEHIIHRPQSPDDGGIHMSTKVKVNVE